ncbi:non-ribosomal peptide synthetase [Streptomyces sp. NBC_01264]|uniref:non-ribosomal peptide synthetase n=1 Tax=Streptomyces sp. NBC_01264 TaxID=2903804 RepID=UPI002258446A|nr:amino acid adenylation domain-containing protein [Streptomyces sp. NBC_01264]MCX4783057.1 amino acid adenylation domain-containing protein [Streptomyces sp. NBC_01264]
MQNSQMFPVTEAQLGLLVIDRTVAARNLYNIVLEFRLDPGIRAEDLGAALAEVTAVQPTLRLGLHEAPSPHAALIEPLPPERLPLDTEQVPAARFPGRRSALLEQLSGHVFPLDDPPLFRAAHLRSEDGSTATLLVVVHHTVFDGFSAGPFAGDLTAALSGTLDVEALRPGREGVLRAELQAQLAAAAKEETEEEAAALAARLATVRATELYPRPGRPTETDFAGARIELPLTAEESKAVDAACRKLGVTPFTFFAAAYAAVLARHSGGDCATLGATLMSRRTLGSFGLCGFFVNTLPMAVPVDWTSPFEEFVVKVVDEEVEDTKFRSHIPFNRIAAHCAPDRSSNRNPVFSALLAMQDGTVVEPGGPVLSVRQHGSGTAKFDLLLFATPAPGGWLLELEHDLALLPPAVAGGIADSLREAVASAARNPGRTLAELFSDAGPVLTAEPARAGDRAADRAADHVTDHATVYEWVMATAAAHPELTAITADGATTTYGELARTVRALARGLAEHGVGHESVVGVATRGLTETVASVLAILGRRAAYLPLDPQLPAERLDMMTAQARCRLVVGEGTFGAAAVLTPEQLAEPGRGTGGAPESAEAPIGARGPGDPVYTMFTSGSTGRPKGVLMGNGALVNLTRWQLDVLAMDETTRFMQYAPIGFDVSFQEIFPTLAAGGTLVSREPVDRRDLPSLVRRVAETGVTHLYLPVAALRPFALAADELDEGLPTLRHICVAGEQLQVDGAVQGFFARRPRVGLFNMYGPTETHVVTAQELTADTQPWPAHVPIGRPIPGVGAQVVDVTGHLAPAGVPGELLLGGECPAQGYVNDPERTAERFVPDPYGTGPDARRYRTGDVVFRDEHGVLVYAGRDDHQVKIRGHRVELGELENAALAVPGVRAAVAAAHKEGAQRELALFLVPDKDQPGAPATVRAALAATLPSYMVPAHVLPVASIPTSHNGKLDRAALLRALPELLAAQQQHADDAEGTDDADDRDGAYDTESGAAAGLDPSLVVGLREIWSTVLDRHVSVHRSLFDQGAHSLNVLTALTRVENRYGVRIPVLDFFKTPTIGALARAVAARRNQA